MNDLGSAAPTGVYEDDLKIERGLEALVEETKKKGSDGWKELWVYEERLKAYRHRRTHAEFYWNDL